MITGKFFAAGADRRIAITIAILLAVAIIVPIAQPAVAGRQRLPHAALCRAR